MTSSRSSRRVAQRVVSGLAVAAVAAVGITACSPGADSSAKTVTVWTWNTPGEGLKAAVPAFEKANPGVKVKVEDVGNPAIWDKITTGMAAGGVGLADVFNIGIDYMGNYIETFPDGLADLRDFGADDLADDFPEAVWKSGSSPDGGVYGIPYESNTAALYFRSDLFEQAGVDMSTIETWDQLIDAGKTVKEATGASLFTLNKAASVPNSADTWQTLMALQNAFYFNEAGDITLNGPEGVRALGLLKTANDAGLVADISGKDDTFLAQLTGDLEVSTLVGSSWMAGVIPNEAPEMSGKWSVRNSPSVEAGGPTGALGGATYLSISNTSKNKDIAWDFVEFAMASTEGGQLVYEGAGLFPGYEPMWETEGFVTPSEYLGGVEANQLFIDQLQQGGAPLNYTSDYAKALKAFDDAQTQVLLQGADPQDALDKAAELLAQQTGRTIAD